MPTLCPALRSGHKSNADLDVVLDFLKDQIAVKKEFLLIAGQARSDEPLKEGQAEPTQVFWLKSFRNLSDSCCYFEDALGLPFAKLLGACSVHNQG